MTYKVSFVLKRITNTVSRLYASNRGGGGGGGGGGRGTLGYISSRLLRRLMGHYQIDVNIIAIRVITVAPMGSDSFTKLDPPKGNDRP